MNNGTAPATPGASEEDVQFALLELMGEEAPPLWDVARHVADLFDARVPLAQIHATAQAAVAALATRGLIALVRADPTRTGAEAETLLSPTEAAQAATDLAEWRAPASGAPPMVHLRLKVLPAGEQEYLRLYRGRIA